MATFEEPEVVRVTTLWMGAAEGPFEMMVMVGPHASPQVREVHQSSWRWRTEEQAVQGHREVVVRVRALRGKP